MIGAAEIGAILAARAKEGRFRYIWSAMAPVDRSETKLIFLMILCIEHTLPLGGQIQVAQRQSGWTVEAAAERTQLDSDLWGSLRRRKAHQPLDSGRVQCAALAMTLIASGRRLAVEQTDRRLTLCL